jgi:hypothetical protein
VWDAAFETLANVGPPENAEHAIDSTIVRAHQHAAGVKRGIKTRRLLGARVAASRQIPLAHGRQRPAAGVRTDRRRGA